MSRPETARAISSSDSSRWLSGGPVFALTQDRIAARRAAVLAYIGNLLLRTLPAMDREIDQEPVTVIWDAPGPDRSQDDEHSSTIQRT